VSLPPRPWIIGHRGAAGVRRENTLASFRRAVEEGADWLELDVQLSADGELAVVHDWDLRRLAGAALVVESAAWSDLAAIRLRAAGGEDASRIPRLRDVLEILPDRLPLNVELKRRGADRARLAEAVLAECAAREPLLFSSFDWPLLAELRRRAPHVWVAPLASRWPGRLLEAGRDLRAWSLHAHRRIVTRALIERASEAGRPVLVYTVNEASEAARFFALGVSGVFTDFPGRLREALRNAP
jgi:glycerophosphoryl diester phosphodiesterase